jgi:hypothetical protein
MALSHLTRLTFLTYLTLSSFSFARARVQNGATLATNEIERVGIFALTPAEWLYKPGYSIGTTEKQWKLRQNYWTRSLKKLIEGL